MHERDIDSAEIGSPKEDARNLRPKIGALDIRFASAWRVGIDEVSTYALIIYFMDMEKNNSSLIQEKGTQG